MMTAIVKEKRKEESSDSVVKDVPVQCFIYHTSIWLKHSILHKAIYQFLATAYARQSRNFEVRQKPAYSLYKI